MRIVRFNDQSGASSLDMHPMLTVVSGLDESARVQLRETLLAIPAGEDPQGTGSIEVHGVFLDLDPTSIRMLELNHQLDVVLRRTDLPGSPSASGRNSEPSPRAVNPTLIPNGGDKKREFVEPEDDRSSHLDFFRKAAEAAETQYDRITEEMQRVKEQIEALDSERANLEEELEVERGGLDSFAVAGLKVAQGELVELEGRSENPSPEGSKERLAELEIILDDLIERSDTLRRQLKRLRQLDPEPVQHAYIALQRSNRGGKIDSDEVKALADKLEEGLKAQAELEARRSSAEAQLAEHTHASDEAKANFAKAEEALRAPELDPQTVDKLESIHDRIFEMSGRRSKFGAAKHQRKLEALQNDERKILDSLGFESWSAYVMGVSTGSATDDRQREFQAAKAAYQLAEAELKRSSSNLLEISNELAELSQRQEELMSQAVRLVGKDLGDDPIGGLNKYLEESAAYEGGLKVEDASLALRHALEAAGTELPPHVTSPDELEMIGGGWLEAMAALPKKIREAESEREAVEVEIAERKLEFDALESGADAQPQADDSPALAAARQRVSETTQRALRHDEATARILTIESRLKDCDDEDSGLRVKLQNLANSVSIAAEQREAARTDLKNAEARVTADPGSDPTSFAPPLAGDSTYGSQAPQTEEVQPPVHSQSVREDQQFYSNVPFDAEALEWYVLARLAQQRSVSFVGSVPLLIEDAFNAWGIEELAPVLDRLLRMSEVIQIIYLTNSEEIVAWARSLGADRASVLDMAPAQPA